MRRIEAFQLVLFLICEPGESERNLTQPWLFCLRLLGYHLYK